jgi:hypothetical protein
MRCVCCVNGGQVLGLAILSIGSATSSRSMKLIQPSRKLKTDPGWHMHLVCIKHISKSLKI